MKSYYGGRIGTHQRSFERYHPHPLRPPLPQDQGFVTLTQELVKQRISNFVRTFVGSIGTKAH